MSLDNTISFYMSDRTKLATVFIPSEAHPDRVVECLKSITAEEDDHMLSSRLKWDILASKMVSKLISHFRYAKIVPGDGVATKYRIFEMDIIPNDGYENQTKPLSKALDILVRKLNNNDSEKCLYDGNLSEYHPKYTTEEIEFKASQSDVDGFITVGETDDLGLRILTSKEVASAYEQGKYIVVDCIQGLFSNDKAGIRFFHERDMIVLIARSLDMKDEVIRSSDFKMVNQKPYHPNLK